MLTSLELDRRLSIRLIYQLLEWERLLAAQTAHLPQVLMSNQSSDGSSVSTPLVRGFSTEVESEEDWSRRRAELEALEEAEELDRDMEERLRRSRTTSASSTTSGSSGGAAPVTGGRPKPPFGIKRRISGSSLASEITLEEDETGTTGEEDENSEKEATRTPIEADEHAMMVDGPSDDPETEAVEPSPKPSAPRYTAPPNGGGRANRKRSSTLSFTPSLDPLPSSPTIITDPTASGSAALASPGPPPPPVRSRSYQSHVQRASLHDVFPASPTTGSFPSLDDAGPPARSGTPSSLGSSTSSRRATLSSTSRPAPVLAHPAEPPRSLQQLLFFPPSPNRSTDPSTPTMTYSVSTLLSSPAPHQHAFGQTPSVAASPMETTHSPLTAVPPPPRLRSMIPPIISPTTGTLNETTPLGNVFGSFGNLFGAGPSGSGGGGGGWGGFGSSHSPKQRKDLHRKTFSLDVKTLVPTPASPLTSTSIVASTSSTPSTFPSPVVASKRLRHPTAGPAFAFEGRRSRAPSVTSLASASSGGSRRSSLSSTGGMQPTPSTPTSAVTEFNARGFMQGTREMH